MKTSKTIHFEGSLAQYSGYMSKLKIEEYNQAKNILESAENRAKSLCEQSQADYESELDRGYEDGKKKADKEISEAMMLHSKRTIEHLKSIEQELVNIVDKSLRQMIGDFSQADLIKRMVTQHLNDITIENSMTLKVHVDQCDEIRREFGSVPEVEKYLNIIPDQGLKDSDSFIMDTPSGRIESSVSMQVNALVDSFKENF